MKLMQTIGVAVAHLDKLGDIVPVDKSSASVMPVTACSPQFDTVGEALLWTLEQGLGDAFTPTSETSVGGRYITLADTMKMPLQRRNGLSASHQS
ncbi:MAG: hypothetical protein H6660_15405 [Ardenticatenaceae bacterium]|nr:hypothetical protein [Ardenticatenaceae bacterium]